MCLRQRPPSCVWRTGPVWNSPCRRAGCWAKWWETRAAAPSMRALSWVWWSSAYCYTSMELPMMRLWGHTQRSSLALCATSRVATSPSPSNLLPTYMGQSLALGRMMSVLAASVPLAPWHFPEVALTAVASASLVGGKVGPCSGTYICSLKRPCAASPRPCSRGVKIDMRSPWAANIKFYQSLQTSQNASLRSTVQYMRRCEALPTHPSSWGKYWDLF